MHPALVEALAAAHQEDLQRAAARRLTIRLARQSARGSRRSVDEAAPMSTWLPAPDRRPRHWLHTRPRPRARARAAADDLGALAASSIAAARPFPRVAVMHEVERLLTAANVQITSVDPEHPDAQYCLQEYVAELNHRSQRGFDPSVGVTALPREVRPPAGEFFVAYLYGEAIGCGAVKHHADAPAEIKRMWIAPRARGLGLGRRLLERLETCARSGGAHVAHIETSAVLVEALSLYRSTGWVEVPAFNDEPFADHWLEKALT